MSKGSHSEPTHIIITLYFLYRTVSVVCLLLRRARKKVLHSWCEVGGCCRLNSLHEPILFLSVLLCLQIGLQRSLQRVLLPLVSGVVQSLLWSV